ncbi:unnamed protein product [Rotaria magnacalcarata]|uniref:Uncharacterized protein n=1 Tax=Rotaria magnacalcarata TaxID=392030 RepID=A0A816WI42_9BILA|nr:unnamed protein product [Rotaria magnacalcarata]
MAERLLPFDEEFQPQIRHMLNTSVDHIQEQMANVESLSADEAEKLLEHACDDFVKTIQTKVEEIKSSVKQRKPDPSSPTYTEDNKKYTAYTVAVAAGMEQSKSLIDTILNSIRNIVSTVVECIRASVEWMWEQLSAGLDPIDLHTMAHAANLIDFDGMDNVSCRPEVHDDRSNRTRDLTQRTPFQGTATNDNGRIQTDFVNVSLTSFLLSNYPSKFKTR